jgi:hypothetical protein
MRVVRQKQFAGCWLRPDADFPHSARMDSSIQGNEAMLRLGKLF